MERKKGNKRRQWQYTHTQVSFVTRNGLHVTCDEGMFDVLTLLKKMGVETHFSCQGDDFGGYICSFTPGMRPVVAKAIELHDKGWLSSQSMAFLEDWRTNGMREVSNMMGTRRRNTEQPQQYFSHERETNGVYGDRTTIRWPKHRRHELHQLLLELEPHI